MSLPGCAVPGSAGRCSPSSPVSACGAGTAASNGGCSTGTPPPAGSTSPLAVEMDELTVHRLTGPALHALADSAAGL